VLSEQSVLIAYQGKPLVSGLPVWWRVRVWDQAGTASAWSRIAHWSMGLLNPEDWQAKWIGHEETSVYKRPRSPFQLLRKARWT
jgi:alpha-L-rhamnosidase